MYDMSWWRPIALTDVDGVFAMEIGAFKKYFFSTASSRSVRQGTLARRPSSELSSARLEMMLLPRRPGDMKFGYFTLSDNHYDNNTRAANEFVDQIVDEAVYADALGMHSAWIGEHHFSTLGVLSCPDNRAGERRGADPPDQARPGRDRPPAAQFRYAWRSSGPRLTC